MMSCVVVSPTDKKKYEDVIHVLVPGTNGVIDIMPKHAEAFIALRPGTIVVKHSNGMPDSVPIEEGEVHIRNNIVTIIL